MIVLDTNVLSELMLPAPTPAVLDWVDAQQPSEVWITAVTAAELRAGVAVLPAGRRRSAVSRRVEQLLTRTFADAVLPFDVDATAHYAEVVAARRRAGRPVSALDAQIAAICRQHDVSLATRNVRDFAATGVEVINPWSAGRAK